MNRRGDVSMKKRISFTVLILCAATLLLNTPAYSVEYLSIPELSDSALFASVDGETAAEDYPALLSLQDSAYDYALALSAQADNATIPPECYLDLILSVENFIQGCIFLAHWLETPSEISDLVAASLTFAIAFNRYFDYLECQIID